jgi:phage anti-repressor protein
VCKQLRVEPVVEAVVEPVVELPNPLIAQIKGKITYDSKWSQQQIDETVSYLVQSLTVDESKEQYPIRLDDISKLLGYSKIDKILDVMVEHFKENLDYSLLENKLNKVGRGGHNKKNYVLTTRCAKQLCMLSNTKKAKSFRMYFIIIEELLRDCIYKINIVGDMESRQIIQNTDISVCAVRNNIVNMVNLPEDKSGVVYFIRSGATDIFKIGFTCGDPVKRLNTLQTGNHTNLTIYRTIYSPNASVLENKVHLVFADRKIRGEWYTVTTGDINSLKRDMLF